MTRPRSMRAVLILLASTLGGCAEHTADAIAGSEERVGTVSQPPAASRTLDAFMSAIQCKRVSGLPASGDVRFRGTDGRLLVWSGSKIPVR